MAPCHSPWSLFAVLAVGEITNHSGNNLDAKPRPGLTRMVPPTVRERHHVHVLCVIPGGPGGGPTWFFKTPGHVAFVDSEREGAYELRIVSHPLSVLPTANK